MTDEAPSHAEAEQVRDFLVELATAGNRKEPWPTIARGARQLLALLCGSSPKEPA